MTRIFFIPLLLFGCFLFLLYALYPQWSAHQRLGKEILQQQELITQRQNYVAQLRANAQDLHLYQNDLQKIQTTFSAELAAASLLGFFSEKALNNGLVLISIAQQAPPTPTETQDIAPFLSFVLRLKGSEESLENFIKDIESSAVMAQVSNIALDFKEQEQTAEISLNINVYY